MRTGFFAKDGCQNVTAQCRTSPFNYLVFNINVKFSAVRAQTGHFASCNTGSKVATVSSCTNEESAGLISINQLTDCVSIKVSIVICKFSISDYINFVCASSDKFLRNVASFSSNENCAAFFASFSSKVGSNANKFIGYANGFTVFKFGNYPQVSTMVVFNFFFSHCAFSRNSAYGASIYTSTTTNAGISIDASFVF